MGAEPVPSAGGSVAGQCVIPFQSTGDGPTPKLTLAKIQDSVSGQINSLRQGIADLEVSPASGPTPGAQFAFATGNPDMEMLFWSGADGNTWELTVEATQPKTRKAQMLTAAKKINARLG